MGLKVGTVKLHKYSKNWIVKFEKEKENLYNIFGDLALNIEHIGSTSIPQIYAKPIIDIAVAVKELYNFEKVINKFENKIEYSIKEKNDSQEILVRKGTQDNITHFIHVMEYTSERYQNTILFRDYLRKNINVAKEYEELKIDLAKKYKDNRKMYTSNKNDFIQLIIKKAKN